MTSRDLAYAEGDAAAGGVNLDKVVRNASLPQLYTILTYDGVTRRCL